MQLRLLGRSGLAVSRLGLGISGWGGDVDEDEAATQLKVFRDAGGTLIESAEGYGDGRRSSFLASSSPTAAATNWSSSAGPSPPAVAARTSWRRSTAR